jgi:dipeptidase E
MKILLASDGSFLINHGYELLGIPKDKINIGYIITATKVASSLDFFERHKKALVDNHYKFTEFDIEGKTREEIIEFFKDKNVVHVEGGNTFYLLKAVRENNFGEVLKDLLNQGLAYVGSSAGAYIMCPSIEVSSWRHDRKEEWWGLEDLTALNYVPFVLKVHYTDDSRDSVQEKMKNLKYPLRILRDGQGILVEDGVYSFKGEGDEVQLG